MSEFTSYNNKSFLSMIDSIPVDSNIYIIGHCSIPKSELDSRFYQSGRLDREINLEVMSLSHEDRLFILQLKTRKLTLSSDCDLDYFANETEGFSAYELHALCSNAALQAMRNYANVMNVLIPEEVEVTKQHFESVLTRKMKKPVPITSDDNNAANTTKEVDATVNKSCCGDDASTVKSTAKPTVTWNDIGGLEEVKRELQETITYPMKYPEKYQKFGMSPSRGVLLYGPPGCGKTMMAKAVANECGASFISVNGPELLSKWYGESERNVRAIFQNARKLAPCVIFFDEIDSLAKTRGGECSHDDKVLTQILTEMDGFNKNDNVFVVAATNRPDILDSAITRPGRLDQLIYIPLPDYESRLSIFKASLKNAPLESGVDLQQLAEVTEGYTGADITEICKRAGKNAIKASVASNVIIIDSIREIDFEMAMDTSRKSIMDDEMMYYEAYHHRNKKNTNIRNTKYQYCNDNNNGSMNKNFKFSKTAVVAEAESATNE